MLKRFWCVVFLIVALPAFRAFAYIGQPVVYINLQSQATKITSKEFFIAAFEDGRKDNTTIGTLQVVANSTAKAETFSIDLRGGVTAIQSFVSNSIVANKNQRPVIIKLNTLQMNETLVSAGVAKGAIKLNVSFYLQKGEDPVHLIDYVTITNYQRKAGPAQQIEPLLRSALTNSLTYLNTWMDAQAGTNVKLAKNFKIVFKDYNEHDEGDTIYYNVNRPLKWADFKGRKQVNSRYGAEIFAGLGYDEEKKIENSTLYLTFAMKVYAPKSACWASTGTLDDYSLNHEQRHFDIAKLVAEHYKEAILAQNPTPDTYDAIISMGYVDALREMNRLQKQYDDETAHSKNTYHQQLWNIRIDKELVELNVKTKAL